MSLTFSHCDATWSYRSFDEFREKLMQSATLRIVKTWNGWEVKPDDDLAPLLLHSDCEGIIAPQDCVQIASRLVEIVSWWPDSDSDKGMALLLVKGLRECGRLGQPLEFL